MTKIERTVTRTVAWLMVPIACIGWVVGTVYYAVALGFKQAYAFWEMEL